MAVECQFLNDRRELLYGLDEAERAVREFTSTYVEWRKPLKRTIARLREGRAPNTYAACFCEKSDVLSQWRSYGGTDQGVAITFKRKRLTGALQNSKATLFPIVYGKLKTADQITQELSEKINELDKFAQRQDYDGAEKESQADDVQNISHI